MKIYRVIFFSVLILLSDTVFAQNILWQKYFGGSSEESLTAIQQTSDGNYIVVGTTQSIDSGIIGNHGSYDFLVIKLSPDGNIIWHKCYGGSQVDVAKDVHETYDKGYIITGTTNSNDGDVAGCHGNQTDFWVLKINSSGNIQWKKCLGGSSSDSPSSIIQTHDWGYIVVGSTYSNDGDVINNHGGYDGWIVKLDNLGSIVWKKCFGGLGVDNINSIVNTSDNGFVIAGYTSSTDSLFSTNHGKWDSWIAKFNANGVQEWQKCYGGSEDDVARSIYQTADSGFVFAGSTSSNDGDVSGYHFADCGNSPCPDYWVVKLNKIGEIEWQKCLGGYSGDYINSIKQTINGGYIMAGVAYSNNGDVSGNHGNYDIWLVKLDTSGTKLWQKCIGGNLADYAWSIGITNDFGYIICGYTSSNNGDVSGNHSSYDGWVLKISSTDDINEFSIDNIFSIYPNPSNSELTIEAINTNKIQYFEMLDIFGKIINVSNIDRKKTMDISFLPSGIYLVRLYTEKSIIVKKIIKE